jgi:BirA family biotin operon repressor/biotin-[acetyl-CoA-carboxylase] ligase
VFEALSGMMASRLAQWDCGAGFAAIRADWLKRAANLGHDIKVAVNEGTRIGRFETVDERGCLVLRLPNGTAETIAAGDVLVGH